MRKEDKVSGSLIKILGISLVLIFITSIGVMATSANLNNVKIILSNGYEMQVITSKTNVADILEENHIILEDNEVVSPNPEEDINQNKTIRITIGESVEIAEEEKTITKEEILSSYETIVETLITEQIVIPFETITKESTGTGTKQNKVVQAGVNGLKEITYKVKYKGEEEIERTEISSKIIKEPKNKIVEVSTVQVTSRGTTERMRKKSKEGVKEARQVGFGL